MSAQPTGVDAGEPFIPIPGDLPGIAGLMAFKPPLGGKLAGLAQQLLRGASLLTEAEREMIAAFVSTRNDCYFCSHLHAAVTIHLLDGDEATVRAVLDSVEPTPVNPKMRALLGIAAKVQHSGRDVGAEDIAQARAAGAQDEDIHDAVLVAAAFCMFNRYVDGLAAITPRDDAIYERLGELRARSGYERS